MIDYASLLTESRELTAAAHAATTDSREATRRARRLVIRARELVQLSHHLAEERERDRVGRAHAAVARLRGSQ